MGARTNYHHFLSSIISLGTNDCKKIFEGREKESMKNIDELIKRVKSYKFTKKTKIVLLAIPPVDILKISDKYEGIESRILTLNNYYKIKANNSKNISFLDPYSILKPNISKYTDDGIHLNQEAQEIVADKITDIVAK